MKNLAILFVLFLLLSAQAIFAQDTNTVYYSLFMEQSVQFGTVDTRIDSGSFKEGESFIIPSAVLPSSPVDFSKYQQLYDALVGGKFEIDYGALNKDILLKIFIRNLDPNSDMYKPKGRDSDTLFAYFEMRLWELPDSNFVPEDVDYFLNPGKKVRLCLPKTAAFNNFLNLVGISPNDSLAFGYFEKDDWDSTGIRTINKPDSICFEGIHLSKIGGGRGNILFSTTGVEIEDLGIIPNEYQLNQNYPNPFNPSTKILYKLKKAGNVKLQVYDILGNLVENLVNDYQNPGTYEVTFDADHLTSGMYFYKIEVNNFTQIKKMILLK